MSLSTKILQKKYRSSLVTVVVSALVFVALFFVPGVEEGTRDQVREWNYLVRSMAPSQGRLHPRIKVLAFDDKSVATMKSPEMSLKEWQLLVKTLKGAGVSRIIIDKRFGFLPFGQRQDLQSFAREVKQSGNVSGGVTVSKNAIPGWNGLEPNERDSFNIRRLNISDNLVEKIPSINALAYGAPPILRSAFSQLGYLNLEDHMKVYPAQRLSGGLFLPYLGVLAADRIGVRDDGLYINETQVPRFSDGRMPINLLAESTLDRSLLSVGALFQWIAKGKDISGVIKANDIVLILPNMFTGNTDFEVSSAGRIPRGYYLVSFMHSVLTGNWVKFSLLAEFFFGLGLIIFGQILLPRLKPSYFYPVFIGVIFAIVADAILAFHLYSWEFNWLLSLPIFCFATLGQFVMHANRREKETMSLRQALRRALPEKTIDQLVKYPESVLMDPKESILTIMFIDIACFSLYAERTDSKGALAYLSKMLERMSEIVHGHGGFIDKSLGDGMLCVFGHHFSDTDGKSHQADQALKCAVELQKVNLKAMIASKENYAPLPLRIGINTGKVFIGNVGSAGRADFTVIGKAVNFAQRLEGACEPHNVLISQTTLDLISELHQLDVGVNRRYINIKHHIELLEAIEVNPFSEDTKDLGIAQQKFRDYFGIKRSDSRWPSDVTSELNVKMEDGSAVVIDFSQSGSCLLLNRYLAVGVSISFDLDSDNEKLHPLLAKHGLNRLTGVVKWGKQKGENYIHGVYFDRLNDEQKNILNNCVMEALSVEQLSAS